MGSAGLIYSSNAYLQYKPALDTTPASPQKTFGNTVINAGRLLESLLSRANFAGIGELIHFALVSHSAMGSSSSLCRTLPMAILPFLTPRHFLPKFARFEKSLVIDVYQAEEYFVISSGIARVPRRLTPLFRFLGTLLLHLFHALLMIVCLHSLLAVTRQLWFPLSVALFSLLHGVLFVLFDLGVAVREVWLLAGCCWGANGQGIPLSDSLRAKVGRAVWKKEMERRFLASTARRGRRLRMFDMVMMVELDRCFNLEMRDQIALMV